MKKKLADTWPCVFRGSFIKEQVNPRLYDQDRKTPFGGFERAWRQLHCGTINPYGSESCPYAEADCALAYFKTAQDALEAKTSRVGLFRVLAQKRGWHRAENKPLAREAYDKYGGQQGRAGDLRGGPGAGSADGLAEPGRRGPAGVAGDGAVGVRRTSHRPQSIGDLLRGDGAGSRTQPYRRHEGQEAANHDGDTRHPVSPPPPERLGDQPPSEDSDLYQGGE